MMADIQELEQWLIDNPAELKAVKESKQALLLQLKINAQEFTQNAESELAALQDTLLAPLVANIKKAIDEVCVEKGYNYVFDTSLGNPIFTDPKHDILADVKRKLNIQQ
jgi:Skp family chaperone for outer membrane proteins